MDARDPEAHDFDEVPAAAVAHVDRAVGADRDAVGTAAVLRDDFDATVGMHTIDGAAPELDTQQGPVVHRDRPFGKEQPGRDERRFWSLLSLSHSLRSPLQTRWERAWSLARSARRLHLGHGARQSRSCGTGSRVTAIERARGGARRPGRPRSSRCDAPVRTARGTGTRAGEPSSCNTSQITATGAQPASTARSTAASVCPRRSSTPPRRARNGNTWPGRRKSLGRDAGSSTRRIVSARSAAPIPLPAAAMVDRDAERRVGRRVARRDHRPDLERVESVAVARHADETARPAQHEVDRLGGDPLRRDREIAFVLAVLVVDDEDHLSATNAPERLVDRGQGHGVPLDADLRDTGDPCRGSDW